jgi:hypothetical protein
MMDSTIETTAAAYLAALDLPPRVWVTLRIPSDWEVAAEVRDPSNGTGDPLWSTAPIAFSAARDAALAIEVVTGAAAKWAWAWHGDRPCEKCGGPGCPWCADTGRDPPVGDGPPVEDEQDTGPEPSADTPPPIANGSARALKAHRGPPLGPTTPDAQAARLLSAAVVAVRDALDACEQTSPGLHAAALDWLRLALNGRQPASVLSMRTSREEGTAHPTRCAVCETAGGFHLPECSDRPSARDESASGTVAEGGGGPRSGADPAGHAPDDGGLAAEALRWAARKRRNVSPAYREKLRRLAELLEVGTEDPHGV